MESAYLNKAVLLRAVSKRMEHNAHKDPKSRRQHRFEHEAFINLIHRLPEVKLNSSCWKYRGPVDHGNVCFDSYQCVECGAVYVQVGEGLPKYCTECGLPMIIEEVQHGFEDCA